MAPSSINDIACDKEKYCDQAQLMKIETVVILKMILWTMIERENWQELIMIIFYSFIAIEDTLL